jgi:quercetin dioxygenase-like cupin family protein
MIKAIKIYTGPDGHTKVVHGAVTENYLTDAISIRFKTTPPHGFYDWHPAPTTQYVVTLAGTLEFETHSGEKFILKPGDILIAMDTTGSGHKWRLIDEQPWVRVYVAFQANAQINFVPDESNQT